MATESNGTAWSTIYLERSKTKIYKALQGLDGVMILLWTEITMRNSKNGDVHHDTNEKVHQRDPPAE